MATASNFEFLAKEWPDISAAGRRSEELATPDPRAACFYSRRALELAVRWLYQHDRGLKLPYQDHLSALLHETTFRDLVGQTVFAKARLVKELGNLAVHSHKPIRQFDAQRAAEELFHIGFWLARTYGKGTKPESGLTFDRTLLAVATATPAQTLDQLQRLEAQLHERDVALETLLSSKVRIADELERLRKEVVATKQRNEAVPDTHDYSEADTRKYFIDLLLKEAGWALDQPRDTEFEVNGMPNNQGKGYVDYVLWGDDGKPLGLVEAKKTTRDPKVGKQQAKLYADCLEKEHGQRPVIFFSNGYEHWIWDDASYPSRAVQGFYKKAELELLIQRRESRRSLTTTRINEKIVERYYQSRAIRRIGESFEKDNLRKALVVMATGAGKTRTVIALCELLTRCNWAKRALFLADRIALVNQAVGAFKSHFPESSPVNLVTEKEAEGRVYVSTYPTMMGLIEESDEGQRRFGVGHFDLVIIDEAHRSVYQKYGAIFDYFDSLLVGLTATPKDEVDKNTYRLFDLERGVPTDAYPLEEAVRDGFLVPPKAVSVPLKFQREGIKYADLSEEDKDEWDALEWGEDGTIPTEVDPAALNKWLFNQDTVDKVLAHLMTRGQTVAGGDQLGKTIVFAKNHDHAEFIATRFDSNYPHYKGHFARVIDFTVEYAQTLIDALSNPAKAPHIAISVDMLDTGIDIPEIVNLVFFKLVRSKTKFWQMLGRGTRLRKDLFGPGDHKAFFYVFDFCQNLEFFSQNPDTSEGNTSIPLGKRLFTRRLDLIGALDELPTVRNPGKVAEPEAGYGANLSLAGLRKELAEQLHAEVTAMDVDNFVVRPKRRVVDRYKNADAWIKLSGNDREELAHHVAGLPSGLPPEEEEAKRFDLILLKLELAVLQDSPNWDRLRDQVKEIAGLLEDQVAIPMVQAALPLIQEIQTDHWWEGVTVPMLEDVRRRLRGLVKLIEKRKRKPLYTDFRDEMGAEVEVALPGVSSTQGYQRFLAKARQFLKEHEDHVAIRKLRMNLELTSLDLVELERVLAENGVGTPADVQRAKEESEGLGLFVRSLVGLERDVAKQALSGFTQGKTLNANQIEFLNLIVDHLTEHGAMAPALLYESPYTDFHPHGVDGVFAEDEAGQLIDTLKAVRKRAVA